MPDKESKNKLQIYLQLGLVLVLVLLVNILANSRISGRPLYGALDLTEEKRYTLTPATRQMLRDLDEVVFVRVLLDGEFPAGFKRLQNATREMLEDFRSVAPNIEYEFSNPGEGTVDEINERRKALAEDGIVPINLRVKGTEGTSTQLVYPYVIFHYGGRTLPVNILENEVPGVPPEVVLNNAVSLLEYKFANAVQKLQRSVKPLIAISAGQGELEPIRTADLEQTLRPYYEVGRLALDSVVAIPQDVRALVVAKPTRPFSEKNKFKLDQYVMNGGKILWLIDQVGVDLDSLQGRKEFYPTPRELNLDDLFFRFGFRLNTDLVLDLRSTRIPLATGMVGNAPQFDLFRYPYHVLALPQNNHPVVKGLEAVNLFFPSSIDTTVQTRTGLRKTVLLQSSDNALAQKLPIGMDFNFLRYDLEAERFNKSGLVMGLLIEGTFSSMYTNRLTEENRELLRTVGQAFREQSPPNRMIIVSDGDLAANPVTPDQKVMPLGLNRFEQYQFSNKDFLINSLEYLLDDQGVITARGKEVKLRLLNTERAQAEAGFWQLLNIGLPLLFLAGFGVLYNWWRRRRYAGAGVRREE